MKQLMGWASRRLRCVVKQWKRIAASPATETLGLRPRFQLIDAKSWAMRAVPLAGLACQVAGLHERTGADRPKQLREEDSVSL